MAQRRIEFLQENASGVFEVVAVTPTAAKGTISLDAYGVPAIGVSPAAIADAADAVADPVPKAEYDLLVAKFNSVLAALRTANVIQT